MVSSINSVDHHFASKSEFKNSFPKNQWQIAKMPHDNELTRTYQVTKTAEKIRLIFLTILAILLFPVIFSDRFRKAWKGAKGECQIISVDMPAGPKGPKIIAFFPTAGNPVCLGHAGALSQGIKKLIAQGYRVKKAKVGLAQGDYVHGKVLHSKSGGVDKRELNLSERHAMLQAAIDDGEELGMFMGVKVSASSGEEGPSGHIGRYDELVQREKKRRGGPRPVALIAGDDLEQRMSSWGSHIGVAVIVERQGLPPQKTPTGTLRLRVERHPDYGDVSSTKIQAGDLHGLGRRGQALWKRFLTNS